MLTMKPCGMAGTGLPLFLGVEDFEAAGGGVGAENCEAAVIGVGACAELAGLGSDVLMRVIQGADGADGVVDGGVEEIFGEIQGDGEDLHDFSGEGAESAVVVGPGLLEFGWLGGPDVGGVAKIGEGFVAGVGRDAGTSSGPMLKVSLMSGGVSSPFDFARASDCSGE